MTEWFMPYNENDEDAFRMNDALRDLGRIEEVQNINLRNVNVGDIFYLYETAPVKAIRWKCLVTDVGRQKKIIDDRAYSGSGREYPGPFIELKAQYEYFVDGLFSLDNLKKHGYSANMQGSSRLESYKPELAEYIHKIDSIQNSEEELLKICRRLPMEELEKAAKRASRREAQIREGKAKQRNRNICISVYVKRLADGRCDLCGEKAPFSDREGNPYLEEHHVKWLCEGGEDSIDNAVALCPNCHRRMHILQDPEDVIRLRKVLKNKRGRREKPVMNNVASGRRHGGTDNEHL